MATSSPALALTPGQEALLEVLRTEGVRHVFGNPGSTELPLLDALAQAGEPEYVLALQEAVVVGMADGYAQATGRPALVSLHTAAGLGNAIGNLTNAQANATPLVVTAGQQDRRHLVADPLLSGDLVGLARPVSGWAHEVRHGAELPTILRRAFHDAAAPPAGPVFVSIPLDVLLEPEAPPLPPPSRIERRTVATGLDALAGALAAPEPARLALVLGDEVAASGAVDEAVALAEALGVAVHGSPLHSGVVFPTTHPLWAGALPSEAAGVRAALDGLERVLLVGGRAFMAYPYTPGPPLPDGCELLHLAPDPRQLGRTWPAALGLCGDPRASLRALLPLLRPRLDPEARAAAARTVAERHEQARAALRRRAAQAPAEPPMHPLAAARALAEAVPADVPVTDESITANPAVRALLARTEPGTYLFCRGGGLGWGVPAALGVSLAGDRRPTVALVGDGSMMYAPQALWTAARERLPVVVVVVDNAQYLILKHALARAGAPGAAAGRTVGLDLDAPRVDFAALAGSMGVPAILADTPDALGQAVADALAAGGPRLVHAPVGALPAPTL
jgi:benzoylformate decarboxylase